MIACEASRVKKHEISDQHESRGELAPVFLRRCVILCHVFLVRKTDVLSIYLQGITTRALDSGCRRNLRFLMIIDLLLALCVLPWSSIDLFLLIFNLFVLKAPS